MALPGVITPRNPCRQSNVAEDPWPRQKRSPQRRGTSEFRTSSGDSIQRIKTVDRATKMPIIRPEHTAFTILLRYGAVRLGPSRAHAVAKIYRSSSGRPSKACCCLESSFEGSARRRLRDLRRVRGRLFRPRGALDSPPDRSERSSFCPFSIGIPRKRLRD